MKYTVADIRAGYSAEKAWQEFEGDLPAYLLYRPVSIPLTAPLLNAGIRPAAVTCAAAVLAASLPVAAVAAPLEWAPLLVAGLGILFHVLDCVDGNMARTLGTASEFGRLLDGFVDQVFWIMLLLALGLLVDRAGGMLAGSGVPVALGIAVTGLLNRQTRDNFARASGVSAVHSDTRPQRIAPGHAVRIALGGLEYTWAPAIALAAPLRQLHGLLVGIGIHAAAVFIVAMYIVFSRASR